MVCTCSVFDCSERGSKTSKISFHSFPKRDRSPLRHEQWVSFCRRENFVPNRSSYICSKHFNETDFDPSQMMKVKLMQEDNLRKPKLLPGSVPSVRCNTYTCTEIESPCAFTSAYKLSSCAESNPSEHIQTRENMPTCVVSYCHENSKRNSKSRRVFFHTFPQRKKSPERYAKWVEYCRQGEDYVPTRHSCICSLHFRRSDYDAHQRMKFKLMPNEFLEGAKLKPGSVPTVPFTGPTAEVTLSEQAENNGKNARKKVSRRLRPFEQSDMPALADDAGFYMGDPGNLEMLESPETESNDSTSFKVYKKMDGLESSVMRSKDQHISSRCPKLQLESPAELNFVSPDQYYLLVQPESTPADQSVNYPTCYQVVNPGIPNAPQLGLAHSGADLSKFVSSANLSVYVQPQFANTSKSSESSNFNGSSDTKIYTASISTYPDDSKVETGQKQGEEYPLNFVEIKAEREPNQTPADDLRISVGPIAHVKQEIEENSFAKTQGISNFQQKHSLKSVLEPCIDKETSNSKSEDPLKIFIKTERVDDEMLEKSDLNVTRNGGEGSESTTEEPQSESFLVSWSRLEQFFESCSNCREKNSEVQRRADGLSLTVQTKCGSCGYENTWKSQS